MTIIHTLRTCGFSMLLNISLLFCLQGSAYDANKHDGYDKTDKLSAELSTARTQKEEKLSEFCYELKQIVIYLLNV